MRFLQTIIHYWPLLVFMFLADSASTSRAEDGLPEVGRWEIVVDGPPGANPFKATMCVVRRDGNRVYGVIEWSPSGTTKTLELFSATADTSGGIRFYGREEHTLVDNMFPTRYRAVLGESGRKLTEFGSTGPGTTGAAGTARWLEATVPKYSPAIEASLNLSGERPLLYQTLSANYVLQDVPTKVGPDIPLLKELASSREKHIRELAQLKLLTQEMYEQSAARDQAAADEWAKGERERRDQVYLLLARAIAPGPSLDPAVDLFNSIGIKKAFDRRRAAIELACIQVAFTNRIRNDVKVDYLAHHQAKSGTLHKKLKVGFKPSNSGLGPNAKDLGLMTLRNDTGSDLHNAFIITRMTVDKGRLDQYAKENEGKEMLAGMFLVAVGVEAKNVMAINNFQSVAHKYFQLEKGAPAFVPLWPKGSVVEVPLARQEDLRRIALSVGAWVGSDEGETEVSLDIDEVRGKIQIERDRANPVKER